MPPHPAPILPAAFKSSADPPVAKQLQSAAPQAKPRNLWAMVMPQAHNVTGALLGVAHNLTGPLSAKARNATSTLDNLSRKATAAKQHAGRNATAAVRGVLRNTTSHSSRALLQDAAKPVHTIPKATAPWTPAPAAAEAPANPSNAELNKQLPHNAKVHSAGLIPLKVVAGISSSFAAQGIAMIPGAGLESLKKLAGTEGAE